MYFFCGRELQYCTCDLRWNAAGWRKAAVLASFALSSALGAQRCLARAGLGGALAGEEGVALEALASVGWRLLPYWLNAWETKWGAECTSVVRMRCVCGGWCLCVCVSRRKGCSGQEPAF